MGFALTHCTGSDTRSEASGQNKEVNFTPAYSSASKHRGCYQTHVSALLFFSVAKCLQTTVKHRQSNNLHIILYIIVYTL